MKRLVDSIKFSVKCYEAFQSYKINDPSLLRCQSRNRNIISFIVYVNVYEDWDLTLFIYYLYKYKLSSF